MQLDRSIDIVAVRNWCLASNVKADIKPIFYRNRIRHFDADIPCDDDRFLFRLKWAV